MNALKQFATWLIQAVIGLTMIGFFALMFTEWAAGCGESYVDAKGKTQVEQCLFFNRKTQQ